MRSLFLAMASASAQGAPSTDPGAAIALLDPKRTGASTGCRIRASHDGTAALADRHPAYLWTGRCGNATTSSSCSRAFSTAAVAKGTESGSPLPANAVAILSISSGTSLSMGSAAASQRPRAYTAACARAWSSEVDSIESRAAWNNRGDPSSSSCATAAASTGAQCCSRRCTCPSARVR